MNILFMCVANAARSQIAEGLGRTLLGEEYRVESAGSTPTQPNPYAIRVMREIGIDISTQRAKRIADLPADFIATLDYVVTLCAEEVCPALAAPLAQRVHWPLPDPVLGDDDEAETLDRFRWTRDQIKRRLEAFADELTRR